MSVSPGILHRYRVCGLRISSPIPLPELCPDASLSCASSADIALEIGDGSCDPDPLHTVMSLEDSDGGAWLRCVRTSEGYRFRVGNLADFLVDRDGRRITCFALPGTPPETLRHLFLDQILPSVLNLRGAEALHASAVEVEGGACAFMGMSGQGKSTLAAAFHVAGHRVLSDDCLVLKGDADQVLVEPAYPGLRLWDDSRELIFGDSVPSRPVSHYNDKRRIATSGFETSADAPLALQAIYSLRRYEPHEDGQAAAFERLSARDALMELISFAFRLDLTDQGMILRQMTALERVARTVPVKRLRLPDDLGAVPQARELVLQDLRRG